MPARKLLKASAIGIGTLILSAIVFLSLFDFGRLKDFIEERVSDATGREFRIEGDLSIKILPIPRLLIEQASLAGPSWSDAPNMLHVGKAIVEVPLLSLPFGPIQLREFQLHDVSLLVEVGPNAELNWDMQNGPDAELGPATQTSEEESLRFPHIDLQTVTISNIRVRYKNPDGGPQQFELSTLKLHSADQGHKQLAFAAQFEQLPIQAEGTITPHHTEMKLTIDDVGVDWVLDHPPGDGFRFQGGINSLAQLGNLLAFDNLPDSPLTLDGHISVESSNLRIHRLNAMLEGTEASFSGMINHQAGKAQLSATAATENLQLFSDALPEIPLRLEADFVATENTLDVSSLTLQLGDSKIEGAARYSFSENPSLSISASSQKLDLSPFEPKTAARTTTDPTPQTEVAISENNSNDYVFDDTPLPIELLSKWQTEIQLHIGQFIYGPLHFYQLDILNTTDNGTLTSSSHFKGHHGGTFQNNIIFQTAEDNSNLQWSTQIQDFQAGLLVDKDAQSKNMPTANADIQLRAQGRSPRALAASLTGRVFLEQGKGLVSNQMLQRFSGDIISQLIRALNPFSEAEPYTQWHCSIISIDFQSGEGTMDGFLLQSEKLLVVGSGNIGLNDETLNFEFNTKPRKGVGVSADMFVTPFVKLTGTLANPSIGLNKKGLLLSGGTAVMTGGLSFLYKGLIDRATAEGDQCKRIRAAAQAKMGDLQ